MKNFLKILGIVLGAIIVLGILFLSFWDFSRYEPAIEAAVSDATGREFRIDGDFEVDILPSPSVLIDGATLANAGWAEDGPMIEIGHAYVRVGLWSLLSRPIVVHELELADVTVRLQENADGAGNWEMAGDIEPQQDEAEETGEPEMPVDVRSARIENVNVIYRRPYVEDMVVVIDSVSVSTEPEDLRVIEATGRLSETPMTLSAEVADAAVDLQATFGEVRFTSNTRFEGDTLDFTLEVGSLANVGKLIEIENLPAENLRLAGGVSVDEGVVSLSEIVATVEGAEVTLDGTLDTAAGTVSLSVNADAESMALFDAGLPAIPASATAEIRLEGETIDVEPFTLAFGDSQLAGALHVEGGEQPDIRLAAQSDLIDLSPFAAEEEAEEVAASEGEAASGSGYVFEDEPLPLEEIAALKADVELDIAVLKLKNTQLENIDFEATASDGIVTMVNTFDGEFGGKYSNQVELDASGEQATLSIDTGVRDLKLGLLSGPDIPTDQFPATNVDLEISAAGNTPRALAASTDGRFVLTQGPGTVENDLIERFSGDIIAQLFSALNPFADKEEFTKWECSVFSVDFESGVGTIDGFLLQGEKLTVVGGGKIDLNDESLNIEFNTKPRSGVGISADMFVTPFVKLSGTLASPSVGLNQKGVLLSGGAAVLTGGMSFLYQGLVDRATAEVDRCEDALAAVNASSEDGTDANEE